MAEDRASPTQFGKYELLDLIGTGGMAEIFKARVAGPDGFEKVQVVKKILPMYAQHRAFIKMLIAEAKVSSVLQHANIVQIFELGEIDGVYYIAMEWVDGPDLLRILTDCTRYTIRMKGELALFMVSEICKGLAYAHSATDTRGRPLHIIHRDVSPSNVLISRQGDVKVMDFGVARADLERASQDRRHKTADGVLKGKLGYMSPEQVIGAEIDHRSDIFALGIMLFEALTLKRLFLGKTDLDTLINIRDVKIDSKLRKHNYIPQGIQALIRKALAQDPRDRFQSASDFQEAILDYLFENRLRVSNRVLATFIEEILQGPPKAPAAAAATVAPATKKKKTRRRPRLRTAADEETRTIHRGTQDLPPDIAAQATSAARAAEVAATEPQAAEPAPTPDEAPAVAAAPAADAPAVDPVVAAVMAAVADEGEEQERIQPLYPGPEIIDAIPELDEDEDEDEDEGEEDVDDLDDLDDLEDVDDLEEEEGEPEPEPEPEPARRRPAHSGLDQSGLTRASFRLKQGQAVTFGPITFTNLSNLLRNRSVSAEELVSIDGGEWQPLSRVEALRELEPGLFEDEAEPPRFEGPISVLMSPRLLYQLAISRVAGKLKYSRASLSKEIFFQNGEPVHIASSLKDDLLGAFMIERSLIKPDDLARAVSSIRDHGGRLGDALVRLGMLKPHDLFRVLELQFRQKFLELFTWQRGWYEFFEGQQPPEEFVWMGNDTVQLITVGVRTQYDLATMRDIFAAYLDQVIALQANPHITHNNLRFNSRELRFYTYLEDGRTLRETIRRYGRTEDECLTLLQVLFVLHQTDLLAFRSPPRPAE